MIKEFVLIQKSNLSLYSLYCAERMTSLLSSSPRHCPWATQLEEMSQQWLAVGNSTLADLTVQRFEPQTSRSRNERVATQSIGGLFC